ncbi:MAG TPA: class I SAM-dependent methyltransferase [Terriglobales bacterium]|nr:class I SAM-dependent methyltransferase [Terriglobales bacterium]
MSRLVARPFRHKLDSAAEYRTHLRSRRGLEIGGPSTMLADDGPVPVYDVLASLDNCLYSGTTIWTGEVNAGNTFVYHPGKQPGRQILCEGADLRPVENSSYDCVLACHCLEHIANPLRALAEWKRVLKKNGLLLLILPHKDGTFDWRRPTTTLAHMIEDYERGVNEDDLTHLQEVLQLHDLSRDPDAGRKEEFRIRCEENQIHRAMHHHVFDTMAALATVSYAGFQILRVDNLLPFNIIILAQSTDQPPDNRSFMEWAAAHRRHSPFPSDRSAVLR